MASRGQLRKPVKIGELTCWEICLLDAADASRELRLHLVATFFGTPEIEKIIHKRLARYHVRGEWFRVDIKPLFDELASWQRDAA